MQVLNKSGTVSGLLGLGFWVSFGFGLRTN